MMKILIACDNDSVLLSKLNNMAQLELLKVEINVKSIINDLKINFPDVLILDNDKNVLSNEKIMKKIFALGLNKKLIISATNSRTYVCFDKTDLLLDLIKILEDFNDNTLESIIYDMLWRLRFNLYSKGTIYLTDAIILAYYNNSLLYDTNELIRQVAQKYDSESKNIRNNIDNALNLAFKYDNLQYDIDFFNGYYDGRKISLKYFITLAVHYIESSIDINPTKLLLST